MGYRRQQQRAVQSAEKASERNALKKKNDPSRGNCFRITCTRTNRRQATFDHSIPITQLVESIHVGGRARTLLLASHRRQHDLYAALAFHLLLQLRNLSLLLRQRVDELRLASLVSNALLYHARLCLPLQTQTDAAMRIRVFRRECPRRWTRKKIRSSRSTVCSPFPPHAHGNHRAASTPHVPCMQLQ